MNTSIARGQQLLAIIQDNDCTIEQACIKLGCNYHTGRKCVSMARRAAPDAEWSTTFTETEDGALAVSESSTIQTLEQLVEACKIDLTLWKVESHEITKHSVARKQTVKDLSFDEGRITGHILDSGQMHVQTMYSIKARFKRREEAPLSDAVDRIILRLAQKAPAYKPRLFKPTGEYLLVPAIFDAHINKRSSDGQYTIQQAADDFMAAADGLISRTLSMGFPIEEVLIPVGNDLLHSDNLHGTTTRGTQMELAGRVSDAITAVCTAAGYLIERAARLAPVRVVMVPGNHDAYSTVWLGEVLAAQFSRHPHVTVDKTCAPRSYHHYGNTLIGLTHGDKVNPAELGRLMSRECREAWAGAVYEEWLIGHFHTRKTLRQYVTEEFGTTIRVIPGLCPVDDWHSMMGLVGSHRAATGILYHREYGPATEVHVFVNELASRETTLSLVEEKAA